MKTIPLIILSALLFLTACNKDDDSITTNEAFEVDYRKTAEFGAGNFSITFENVIEDSRCPLYAICVWEGRTVVEIKVQEEENIWMHRLATLNSSDGDSLLTFQHDGYTIKLIDVKPYPETSTPVNHEDYSVELEISNK